MYGLVLAVHVIVCIFLIIVVLLQSGKAADLAGAFGGMGSQTAFGPRGSATLLSKATTLSAILFMVTSLTLSIMATRNAGLGTTVLETAPQGTMPIQKAPASVPIQMTPPTSVPVTPQSSGNPGQVNVDMSGAKPATPAPAPAKKK